MASELTKAYVIPPQQAIFCCQKIIIRGTPTLELEVTPNDPGRQSHGRKDVESLSNQHVLEIPANPGRTNHFLATSPRIIQVQQDERGELGEPRFFAIEVSEGDMDIETYVKVSITEAQLQSDWRFQKDPSTTTTGTLGYDCCVHQTGSYLVSFWRKLR